LFLCSSVPWQGRAPSVPARKVSVSHSTLCPTRVKFSPLFVSFKSSFGAAYNSSICNPAAPRSLARLRRHVPFCVWALPGVSADCLLQCRPSASSSAFALRRGSERACMLLGGSPSSLVLLLPPQAAPCLASPRPEPPRLCVVSFSGFVFVRYVSPPSFLSFTA